MAELDTGRGKTKCNCTTDASSFSTILMLKQSKLLCYFQLRQVGDVIRTTKFSQDIVCSHLYSSNVIS